MARNPKPIRRHYKAALRIFRRRGNSLGHKPPREIRRKFDRIVSPLGCYVLIGRKPIKVKFQHWAIWFETRAGRVIKQITLPDGVRVSTVFLGLDHSHFPGGPPVLFETMIFGGAHDQFQARYTTYEAALVGHQSAIAKTFEV